jgi:sRNA-binding protein
MKVCRKCSKPHERDHAWCGDCFGAYQREWQRKNKDKMNAYSRAQYKKHRQERLVRQDAYRQEKADEIKAKVEALKAQKRAYVVMSKDRPCVDCGHRWPAVAMDFDDVQGIKKGNVAQMAGGGHSMKALVAEIAKCEVVCACCHRVRTESRRKVG